MKNVLKYLVGGLIALFTLTCIGFALADAAREREKREYRSIAIQNDSPQGHRFLEDEEVIVRVEELAGTVPGRKIKDIDLHRLETQLDQFSCILKSQVYADREGTLHIRLSERKPFLRLQAGNEGFYADREGKIFPLQSRYSAWVPVVDGHLPIGNWYRFDEKEQAWLDGMIDLVAALQESSKWKNRCTQIHVNRKGQLILMIDGYDEKFIWGDFEKRQQKLKKIEQYISLIRPQLADGKTYKSVNLRFDGQIICK